MQCRLIVCDTLCKCLECSDINANTILSIAETWIGLDIAVSNGATNSQSASSSGTCSDGGTALVVLNSEVAISTGTK